MIDSRPYAEASKASVDRLFELGDQTLRGVQQLTALNVQATKTLLAELAEGTQAALGARSVEELYQLQTAAVQGVPAKAAAYLLQVQEIFAGLVAAQRAATQWQADAFQARFLEAVDGALKNAPGAENAVALVKSALVAASNAVEGADQAGKQVSEAVTRNLTKLAEAA